MLLIRRWILQGPSQSTVKLRECCHLYPLYRQFPSHTSPAPPSRGRGRQRRQHRDKLGRGYMLSTCYKQLRNNIRMKSTVDTHLLLVYMWLVFIFFYSPPQEEGLLFPVSWLSWEECSAVQCTPSYPSPSSRWTVLIKSWLVLSSPVSRLQAPGSWGRPGGEHNLKMGDHLVNGETAT